MDETINESLNSTNPVKVDYYALANILENTIEQISKPTTRNNQVIYTHRTASLRSEFLEPLVKELIVGIPELKQLIMEIKKEFSLGHKIFFILNYKSNLDLIRIWANKVDFSNNETAKETTKIPNDLFIKHAEGIYKIAPLTNKAVHNGQTPSNLEYFSFTYYQCHHFYQLVFGSEKINHIFNSWQQVKYYIEKELNKSKNSKDIYINSPVTITLPANESLKSVKSIDESIPIPDNKQKSNKNKLPHSAIWILSFGILAFLAYLIYANSPSQIQIDVQKNSPIENNMNQAENIELENKDNNTSDNSVDDIKYTSELPTQTKTPKTVNKKANQNEEPISNLSNTSVGGNQIIIGSGSEINNSTIIGGSNISNHNSNKDSIK